METLDFFLEKASVADDGGTVAGLAATFNEQSVYGDVIKPGAFAATLAAHQSRGTSPAMLFDHNPAIAIGRWTALIETPGGLQVEGRITDATEKAREVRQLLREGVLTGLSIGFIVPSGGQERQGERRTINALDLHEVSIVATPALPSARVREVRACANVREFEDGLREVFGLSRRKAHAAASKAWRVINGDEAPDEERIRAALARINAATAKLQPQRYHA